MERVLIVAVAENGVIGKDGDIPWHAPADLQHFKETTMGHPCIMGRTTYEGILDSLGEPLPGRTSIVLSFEEMDVPDDVVNVHSIDTAVDAAADRDDTAYIIGGASIYRQFLAQDLVDRMLLTRIPQRPDGDTYFPDWDEDAWTQVDSRSLSDDLTVEEYRRAQ